METLAEIVRNYQEQFGFAVILVIYAVLSFIVTVILFGVIRFASTGRLTGHVPNTNLQIELGGAIVGFLATVALLAWFHTSYVPPPPPSIEIRGNVFWKEAETPVEGASVSIDGANIASVRTNAEGLFIMRMHRIATEPRITVRARFGDAGTQVADVDRDKAKALRLLLTKPPGSDAAYQKKYELYLAFAEDMTQFLNRAKWTDDVARELDGLRKKGAKAEIERKEAQFSQLRDDVNKLFPRIKKEYEEIRLKYVSGDVLRGLQDFGAWWDATAAKEGKVETSPDAVGQIKFQALLEAMRRELGK